MKQFIGFLGFIALLAVAWVSVIGPSGGMGGVPRQEVDLLPDVTFLGEGPATFTIEPDHTFVIKYRRNNYKNEPGPTYTALPGERVWSFSFVPDDGVYPYHSVESFGPVTAGCVVQFVQIDDDVDERINHFDVNSLRVYTCLLYTSQSNPRLSALVTEQIGDGWLRDLDQLAKLEPLADDAAFRAQWRAVKAANKACLLYTSRCV